MSTINRPLVNIDVPDFPNEGINPDHTCISDALDDNQRRWLVIGICIHSIISPALRQFVAPKFQQLYQTLCANQSIDTQRYRNHLRNYHHITLNYEAINNNRGRQRLNYAVRNEVELSKLFLPTYMAFHTGFDHTCDTSALLTFLIEVDVFEDRVKQFAERFRNEVRNPWAHCNFRFWTKQTYNDAFQVMKKFVCSLGLPDAEKMGIKRSIIEWETNGESFFSGSTLGLELVICTASHISDMRKHVKKLAEQTKAEFLKEIEDLNKIEECLSKFDEEFKRINITLGHHSKLIGDHGERISNIEETLQQHQELVNKHGSQTEQNKEDIQMIYSRMQNSEQTNPRPIGNILFTVPCRRKVVGREKYLQEIKDLFDLDQSERKIALCGLGGIGKTSIVIEYAWTTHTKHYQGGVFWFSGQNGEAFEYSICNLAAVIGTIGGHLVETKAKTFNWISLRRDRCLIVIDNVDEDKIHPSVQESITEHLRFGQNNHVIITTRRSDVKAKIDFKCCNCLTVPKLSDSDSAKLVKNILGNQSNENDFETEKLCSKLHGLPLAIEQAATMIKSIGCTVSEYIEEFEKNRIDLLDTSLPPQASTTEEYRRSVLTTWKMNIDNITKKAHPLAVKVILPFFAFLSSEEIPIEIINEGNSDIKDETLGEIVGSNIKKRRLIQLFTEHSVVQENEDRSLRIHPLVQEFILHSLKIADSDLSQIAKFAVAMMKKACEDAVDKTENVVLCARLSKQCAALKHHFRNMKNIAAELSSIHLAFNLYLLMKTCGEEIKDNEKTIEKLMKRLEVGPDEQGEDLQEVAELYEIARQGLAKVLENWWQKWEQDRKENQENSLVQEEESIEDQENSLIPEEERSEDQASSLRQEEKRSKDQENSLRQEEKSIEDQENSLRQEEKRSEDQDNSLGQ